MVDRERREHGIRGERALEGAGVRADPDEGPVRHRQTLR
jgi:hypothetical protein